MKSDPEHHHVTGHVTLPCEMRSVKPVRQALPIAQIYIREPKPRQAEQPPVNPWYASLRGKPKPAKEDKFAQRLSRLN